MPTPITLKETINKINEISDQLYSYDINSHKLLSNLCSRLQITESSNKEHKWDIPSMIIGGLFATAIALFLFSQTASADSLVLNLTSIHADKTYKYNAKNTGLGYLKNINRHLEIESGFFENSYNKTSLYAMANLKHEMHNWSWGIAAGFVTGYDNIEDKQPMQSKKGNVQKSSSEREQHGDEHDKEGSKYKYKYRSHSHPKNLNAIQFITTINGTWKITKKHGLRLNWIPSFSKKAYDVIGVKYLWKFN